LLKIMEPKICPALMGLLALAGAATAVNASAPANATATENATRTEVDDRVEPIAPIASPGPVESAEWASNSSAPVVTESNSKPAPPIDPSVAPARSGDPTAKPAPAPLPNSTRPDVTQPDDKQDVPYHWLDTTRRVLYNSLWKSSRYVDRWFGSSQDDSVYQKVHGSISPALLYTQYDGMRAQLRFNMNFPFPEANDRLHAFVGRFDPNEFITERDEPSGAIARTYGPPTEDQTLLGIGYHQPDRQGSRFDAGAGIRLSFPLDPYVKGSYVYERGKSEDGLFAVRETIFWQNSEGAGETTRLDLERIFDNSWLARYTLSGTRSQKSEGLRGYTSILLLHGFAERRAIAFEVGTDGQTEASVQLHDYGFKTAYRQGILRRWLIMEVRASLDWPRDFIYQRRSSSLGVGIGFEMLIGTEEFLARPITF
jgi:hypothetical protein